MKQHFFIFALSIYVILGCSNGRNNAHTTDTNSIDTTLTGKVTEDLQINPPASVEEIQTAYAKTVAYLHEGKLDSSTFDYNCQDERTGRVTYFTDNGQLLLIRHRYGEFSHFEADEEYYVQGDQLYFIFNRATSWAFDSAGGDGATQDNITEQRIYIRQSQAFQCLQKDYVLRSAAKNNPDVNQLPSKTTDCQSAKPLLNSYLALRKRQANPSNGCIETRE